MGRRKTIEIKTILDNVNRMNAESTVSPAMREGWSSLLESILMDANVYRGFGYLEAHHVPAGQLPGVIRRTVEEGGNVFPDESRRVYYTHPALTTSDRRAARVA